MKPIKIVRIFLLILIIVGIGLIATERLWVPGLVDKIISSEQASNAPEVSAEAGYKDISYSIEGHEVRLVNGRSETEAAPGSASKIITAYFGNEAVGDLNGDGVPDIAFLLTQTTGGTGTFFYVVAAIKTAGGYKGTNAIFIGDRIAPQATEIKDGIIIANFADRRQNEPAVVKPSIAMSKHLKVEGTSLVEIK
jgi:hypothetical protein